MPQVRHVGTPPSVRGKPTERYCAQCGGLIEGKYIWFSLDGSDEVPLHLEACKDAYVTEASPVCDWCGKKMCNGFSRVSSDTLIAVVHDACIVPLTSSAACLGCAVCKRLVTKATGGVMIVGSDQPVHPACQDEFKLMVSDKCTHCARPILDSLVQISDPHSYGLAKLHPNCLQPFKQEQCPRCSVCAETILSSRYSVLREKAYHDECLIKMRKRAAAPGTMKRR